MRKAFSRVSWKRAAPPAIIAAASDGALDEFLPEETPTAPASISRHEPPLFRHVDERVPSIDLATYEIRSIVPPAATAARPHARVARVAQSLVGALLVMTAVRGYQIYVRPIAGEPGVVRATGPAPQNPEPATDVLVPPPAAATDPPSSPRADAISTVAERAPDRAKTHTVARGVPRNGGAVVHASVPAPVDPEAAAAFWRSRGLGASVPSTPPPLPSGGSGPVIDGAPLGPAPAAAPPPTRVASAPIPVASPPSFLAPSSPMEITLAAGASAQAADTAAIESVLTQYRTAFARLDASAVAALWPSVDSRALNRAFDQLEAQTFEFDRCTTDLKGDTAVASCRGRARLTPRGSDKTPRVEQRRWTFTLDRANGGWMIRRVESARAGA